MIHRLTFFLVFAAGVGAVAAEKPAGLGLTPSTELQESGKGKVSEEAQRVSKRALAALEKGATAAARRDFEKVLELVPGNVPTLINLGLVDYRQKKLPEAEKSLKQAVKGELGLAVLSLASVAAEIERGELTTLDVQGFPLMRSWHVAYPAGKALSHAAKEFRTMLFDSAIANCGLTPTK